jgi:ribose-phosphate pyrophosphokinase
LAEWVVAPGPASRELASALAKALKVELVDVEGRVFPDGESKVRLRGEVRDRNVILVQSTYPPVDRHLVQLLFLAHRISEEGGMVHAAVPYLAYARQDKEFLKGEVVSLAVVAHLLRSVGVKRLVTVDIHSVEGLGYFSFPAFSTSATPLLARHFEERRLKDPVAISPDLGGSNRVEAFARLMGIEHLALSKTRDRFTGEVSVRETSLPVDGRDVVLVDDIISTGGSMCRAAELLKRSGARNIYAACTHPLLVGDALERLKAAGIREVVGTNTIPSPVSRIDVSSLLRDYFESM